jgi:hypothetical protein
MFIGSNIHDENNYELRAAAKEIRSIITKQKQRHGSCKIGKISQQGMLNSGCDLQPKAKLD